METMMDILNSNITILILSIPIAILTAYITAKITLRSEMNRERYKLAELVFRYFVSIYNMIDLNSNKIKQKDVDKKRYISELNGIINGLHEVTNSQYLPSLLVKYPMLSVLIVQLRIEAVECENNKEVMLNQGSIKRMWELIELLSGEIPDLMYSDDFRTLDEFPKLPQLKGICRERKAYKGKGWMLCLKWMKSNVMPAISILSRKKAGFVQIKVLSRFVIIVLLFASLLALFIGNSRKAHLESVSYPAIIPLVDGNYLHQFNNNKPIYESNTANIHHLAVSKNHALLLQYDYFIIVNLIDKSATYHVRYDDFWRATAYEDEFILFGKKTYILNTSISAPIECETPGFCGISIFSYIIYSSDGIPFVVDSNNLIHKITSIDRSGKKPRIEFTPLFDCAKNGRIDRVSISSSSIIYEDTVRNQLIQKSAYEDVQNIISLQSIETKYNLKLDVKQNINGFAQLADSTQVFLDIESARQTGPSQRIYLKYDYATGDILDVSSCIPFGHFPEVDNFTLIDQPMYPAFYSKKHDAILIRDNLFLYTISFDPLLCTVSVWDRNSVRAQAILHNEESLYFMQNGDNLIRYDIAAKKSSHVRAIAPLVGRAWCDTKRRFIIACPQNYCHGLVMLYDIERDKAETYEIEKYISAFFEQESARLYVLTGTPPYTKGYVLDVYSVPDMRIVHSIDIPVHKGCPWRRRLAILSATRQNIVIGETTLQSEKGEFGQYSKDSTYMTYVDTILFSIEQEVLPYRATLCDGNYLAYLQYMACGHISGIFDPIMYNDRKGLTRWLKHNAELQVPINSFNVVDFDFYDDNDSQNGRPICVVDYENEMFRRIFFFNKEILEMNGYYIDGSTLWISVRCKDTFSESDYIFNFDATTFAVIDSFRIPASSSCFYVKDGELIALGGDFSIRRYKIW